METRILYSQKEFEDKFPDREFVSPLGYKIVLHRSSVSVSDPLMAHDILGVIDLGRWTTYGHQVKIEPKIAADRAAVLLAIDAFIKSKEAE